MFIFYIENRRHIKSDDLTLERDMSETHNITPIWFADPDATDHARVGGKGANWAASPARVSSCPRLRGAH